MQDDFAKRLEQIEVDVGHLDGVGRYLRALLQPLEEARTSARQAEEVLLTYGGKGGSAFGGYDVGGVPELHRRTGSAHVEFTRNLANIATGVDSTARAVRGVARDYQSVEQRNKLAAAEVIKRLSRR